MRSEPRNADAWNRFADVSRALLVGGAVAAPMWERNYRTGFDALTAVLATSATARAVKALWRERRPNGQNHNSFPSQHAGDCFAAAMVLHRRWPDDVGALALGLGTAVSLARLFSGKHHVADVIAGAALGIVAGAIASDHRPRSELVRTKL